MSRRLSSERAAYWREHVVGQLASGLSIRGYCLEHGLSEPSFYAWRRKLRDREDVDGHSFPAGLIPVQVVDSSSPERTLDVHAPNGVRICVREDASGEILQRVVRAASTAEVPPC